MPQCKRDGCREPAVYGKRWGHKRYCAVHGEEYADRRDRALRARAEMPDCESGLSPSCEGKVGARRAARGETVCRFCAEAARELREACAAAERAVKADRDMRDWLDRCDTVEELRDWIKEHML